MSSFPSSYPWRVLVFPAASELGLEIHRALAPCKEVFLYGAVQEGPSAADFFYEKRHTLPRIDEEGCLTALQALIEEEKIDAIFPAYDDVTVWLRKHETDIPCTILAPSLACCTVCRSKKATYEKLGDIVDVPHLYKGPEEAVFPVFVKPDCGQGSQRARKIHKAEDLQRALTREPDLLIMEALEGEEYTVDCFSQKDKGLLFSRARRRIQTRTGISSRTKSAQELDIQEWAQKISSTLEMDGPWFFQVKKRADGSLCLLEVAPRIAGSMAATRIMGANFPLLALYNAAGYDLNIATFDSDIQMGRSLDIRFLYDKPIDALYIDLDHTLLLRGQVNTMLVQLIFQCRNKNIPVRLLTKHQKNLDATLAKYRLSELFDAIIHLPADPEISKGTYIKEENAVLIEDSCAERLLALKENPNVRCFDPAAAICLLDKRS